MKNNKVNIVISSLIICLIVAAGTIFYTNLPYSTETLIMISISVLIMGIIPNKFIFLYGIIVILSFGTFLTFEAFINTTAQAQQVTYMYIHLLATSFLLLYWILLQYIKKIGNQNKQLKDQIKLLEKYDNQYKVLTNHEFIEEAKMIFNIASRRNEELWLLKVHINSQNKFTDQSLKEELSKIVLDSTRNGFDIVTIKNFSIYIILQNTHETGVEIVKKRIHSKAELFFDKKIIPFYLSHQLVYTIDEIIDELEEK